jgi:hypothetical protein
VARGRVLVDGFHRWQAHKKENAAQIQAIDLGDLTDIEILKEAIQRNAAHGHQLSQSDKKKMAGEMYDRGMRDEPEMAAILSISERALRSWLSEPKQRERDNKKAMAWDMWLDCHSERDIAEKVGVTQPTVGEWVKEIGKAAEFFQPSHATNDKPWGVVQHFDVWSFQNGGDDSSYFGRMPPAVVENLLWLYTEPGEIVVDPFAGGGTTIDVAKAMGRCVWASDAFGTGWRSAGKRYGRCGLSAS